VKSRQNVTFDANLYSVPYNLVHELVEIRSTPTTVEILHRLKGAGYSGGKSAAYDLVRRISSAVAHMSGAVG